MLDALIITAFLTGLATLNFLITLVICAYFNRYDEFFCPDSRAEFFIIYILWWIMVPIILSSKVFDWMEKFGQKQGEYQFSLIEKTANLLFGEKK